MRETGDDRMPTPDETTSEPAVNRHLDWPLCFNARDLGGLRTCEGGVTRRHTFIRADTCSRLSPAGVSAARAYGVRTIVDLRSEHEIRADPVILPPPVAEDDTIEYLHRPLEDHSPESDALMQAAQSRAEVYRISLDYHRFKIAQVMRALATARIGGVVFHCQAGKDRTGVVAALLLDLVGVARDDVAADYVESQTRLWPLYEERLLSLDHDPSQDAWFRPVCLPETIHDLLAYVDTAYGGTAAYLTRSGLSLAEVVALRRRLLRDDSP